MAKQQTVGAKGESFVADYLRKKGYEILERNWRHHHQELDIIALYEENIVFVEVKTRAASYLSSPLEAVDKKKMRYLIQAADAYIKKHKIDAWIRFDVASVLYDTHDQYKMESYVREAFNPMLL